MYTRVERNWNSLNQPSKRSNLNRRPSNYLFKRSSTTREENLCSLYLRKFSGTKFREMSSTEMTKSTANSSSLLKKNGSSSNNRIFFQIYPNSKGRKSIRKREHNVEIIALDQLGLRHILSHIREKMGIETTVIDAEGRSSYHNEYWINEFANVARDSIIERHKRELAARRGQFPYGPVKLRDDPNWNPEVRVSPIDTIVQCLFRISVVEGQKPWDRGSSFPDVKDMIVRKKWV